MHTGMTRTVMTKGETSKSTVTFSFSNTLPFNHGLPIGYANSDTATGAQAIEVWNIFTG
jgi:hypothetical protein